MLCITHELAGCLVCNWCCVFYRIESDLLQLCEKYIKDFNLEDELKKTEAGLDNLAKVTIIHSRLVFYDSLLKPFMLEWNSVIFSINPVPLALYYVGWSDWRTIKCNNMFFCGKCECHGHLGLVFWNNSFPHFVSTTFKQHVHASRVVFLCPGTTALVIHVGVRLALTWLGHVTELSPLFL